MLLRLILSYDQANDICVKLNDVFLDDILTWSHHHNEDSILGYNILDEV